MNSNSSITLRIIDGADKGQDFSSLSLPVSIGREGQNTIRLHDEKVSRYHCKIQEDRGKLVLADIDSTNGTLLNGQTVHIAPIQPGDLISVGQTLLIVGSREEIVCRLAGLEGANLKDAALRLLVGENSLEYLPKPLIDEMEIYSYDVTDALKRLHCIQPPELPKELSLAQRAELVDIFLYLQLRMRMVIEKAGKDEDTDRFFLAQKEWQCLLDLFTRLNDYYSKLSHPE